MAIEPSFGAESEESVPRNEPIGVRAPPRMTMSFMKAPMCRLPRTGLYHSRRWSTKSGRFGERIEPGDTGKAGEIGVGAAEREAVLDGESGKVGVGHEITGRLSFNEKLTENDRILARWLGNPDARMGNPLDHLLPRHARAERSGIHSRIGRKPQEREQDLPRKAHSGARIQLVFQPRPCHWMLRIAGDLRVQQQIRVDQDHL